MHSQDFTALMSDAFKGEMRSPFENFKKMEVIADQNKIDLSERTLPEGVHLPNADELVNIRQWAINYQKSNKTASKRQIRKATQEHFNVKVYR